MKKAEAYLEDNFYLQNFDGVIKKSVIAAIKQVQKEAIEECKSIMYDYDIDEASSMMDLLIDAINGKPEKNN